jgi:hypothetical protein
MYLMSWPRIQFLAMAFVLFTVFFATSVAQPTHHAAAVRCGPTTRHAAAQPAADWIFEGCWTQFPQGPCRDVFRDQQGNYYICRACGTTGNPTPGKCSPISQATLASGFWCS